MIAAHQRKDEGLSTSPERVLVTAGCQEALALCLPELCSAPGDVLLVCNPAYIGALDAARHHDIGLAGISLSAGDLSGQIVARVEELGRSARRVRALYLVPNFDNPSGSVLNSEERKAIVDVCAREQIVILEDNAYGMFSYEGVLPLHMAATDPGGCVIHLSSYSKTLAPGLRVGAATLPETLFGSRTAREALMARLVARKEVITLNTAGVNQAIVGGILLEQDFSLKDWVAPARNAYRKNRDALLDQMAHEFSGMEGTGWVPPVGGFFLSVDLPFDFDLDEAMRCAQEHGVIVMPMRFFALDRSQDRRIRLAFSSVTPERAREGVRGLARHLEARLGQIPNLATGAA